MKIYDCEQLSVEWWELHRGRATAGEFSRILTAKTEKASSQQDELIDELIAQERTSGPFWDTRITTAAMQNGIDTEQRARDWYALDQQTEVKRVGFCLTDDGRFGCSPDGMTADIGLEIKCPLAKTHVGYLRAGKMPDQFKPQVHGCMVVTGFPAWDFVSFHPDLPPLYVRVERDGYTDRLAEELEAFWEKLQAARSILSALEVTS